METNWLTGLFGVAGLTLLDGTILAVLTWAICATFLRKSRPALQGALWTIVLLKFLVPPVVPGSVSLSGWLRQLFVMNPTPTPASPVRVSLAVGGGEVAAAPAATTSTVPWLIFAVAGLYLAVVGILLLRWIVLWARMTRKVKGLPDAPAELMREVRQGARLVGLQRLPQVKVCQGKASPYVVGLLRPRLVLPDHLTRDLSEPARRALIVHELAHLRRGDLWVRCLQNTARLLLFFWPPVWWVCRKIESCAEMACDQWAVAFSRISPDLYATSLLEIVKGIAVPAHGRHQLAFADKERLMEERFEMILKKNSALTPKLSWLMVPALAAWVSFALAGGTSETIQKPGKKMEKRVVVHSAEAGDDDHQMPAELMQAIPEADLDGDGVITFGELKAHLNLTEEAGPHRIMIKRMHKNVDGQDMGETVEFEVAPGGWEALVARHPEADLDGDGDVSKEEFHQFMMEKHGREKDVLMFRRHEGGEGANITIEGEDHRSAHGVRIFSAGSNLNALLERHPEADLNGDGDLSKEELHEFAQSRPNFFLRASGEGHAIHLEDEMVHAGAENDDAFVIAAPDLATALEQHPEADLNGDGSLTDEELSEWARSQSDHVVVRIGGATGEGNVFLLEGGKEAEWVTEDGQQVFIRRLQREGEAADGTFEIRLHPEHQEGVDPEEMAINRRQQLLKKYPDADLDGDGQISKEEAKALAIRLQKIKKPQQ